MSALASLTARSTLKDAGRHPHERRSVVAPNRNAGMQGDVRRMQRFLERAGHLEEFRRLQQPRPGIALAQAVLSWIVIALTWLVTVVVPTTTMSSVGLVLLALVLIASRQRALGNTLHDAGHGNAWDRKSEWIPQWLLAAPMLEELSLYRRDHLAHHAYLGDPAKDPDYLDIPARLKGTPGERSAGSIFLHTALTPKIWINHCLGELMRLPARGLVRSAVWWGTVLTVISLTLGGSAALTFAGLWFGARATTYHLLKVFTELSDHVGLRVGSVLGYTRNMPANWASLLLHPHNDSYHLTHHLAPRVCMLNLPRMHELLMALPEYRDGHQCDGYVFGKYPVARGWARSKTLASSVS